MLCIKAVMLAVLLSFSLNGAASCNAQKRGNAGNSGQSGNTGAGADRQPENPQKDNGAGDLKMLAQGQRSSVRNAFIAVARDVETYGALGKLVPNLPERDQNFFKSNLVVAAFLGERSSGGYGVRLTRGGNGTISVDESRPPKGSMTIQVITYPFAVAAVPVNEQQTTALEVGEAWRAMTRAYKVTDGEFTMSGGIMGRAEKFGIAGSVGVMREANLVTFQFDLQSRTETRRRLLKEIASGVVQADGRVRVDNMGAGSFVDPPADALRAVGLFAGNDDKLSLTFESIPGQIADGFNGRGSLNAEAVSPAPPKREAATEDAPR